MTGGQHGTAVLHTTLFDEMETIRINKEMVLQEVRRMSEYVGLKSGSYDRVRMTRRDEAQASMWITDAMSGLLPVLDRVTRGVVEDDGSELVLRLDVRNSAAEQLQRLAERYASAVVLARWLRLVAPELTEVYAADEQRLLQELLNVAYFREMPS